MSQSAQELFGKNLGTSRRPFYFGLVGAIAGLLIGLPNFYDYINDGALQATEILTVVGVMVVGALIGVGIAKWKSINNKIKFGLLGAILGALLGVPASYLMQSGILRAWVSIVDYVTKFSEILQDSRYQTPAIVGIALTAIVGAVIGVIIARKKGAAIS